MSSVLVTGGTGVLGSRVVSRLAAMGHDVKIFSRRVGAGEGGATVVRGEMRSGQGLREAVAGVESIVHCASSALWRARTTEVQGVRNLIEAVDGAQPHLLYISIVGVDRIPYYYYRAKWEAEQIVEAGSLPWTILRATQFHSLPSTYALGSFIAMPKGIRAQLVDASEVAGRLVELVEAGPGHRVPDFGGPEVLSIRDVARLRQEIRGERLRVIETPALGKTVAAFKAGHNLCPDQAEGRITHEEYLRSILDFDSEE